MTKRSHTPPELLGLFPDLSPARVGGVELSGQLAWQAVQHAYAERGAVTQLFCYAPNAPRATNDADIFAASKLAAVRALMMRKNAPRVILAWHLGLLKLVPFVRAPAARVIVFLHGIEAWRAQDALTRRMLPRVSLFLSNSAFTWTRFLEFAPQLEKAAHRVVPLGTGIPTNENTVPEKIPAALMLSRLARSENYKGHREMIAAWRGVREKIANAELWIAGDGDLRADLETLVREKNLADSVRFFGRVSESEKQNLLAQCRCFVMPGRGEGFGLVYVEAMRAGRPCLCSTRDASFETVNPPEAGLAVNPNDAQAVAEATCRLLTDDGAWQDMSRAARTRYAAHFTAAHFQQRLLDALAPL